MAWIWVLLCFLTLWFHVFCFSLWFSYSGLVGLFNAFQKYVVISAIGSFSVFRGVSVLVGCTVWLWMWLFYCVAGCEFTIQRFCFRKILDHLLYECRCVCLIFMFSSSHHRIIRPWKLDECQVELWSVGQEAELNKFYFFLPIFTRFKVNLCLCVCACVCTCGCVGLY